MQLLVVSVCVTANSPRRTTIKLHCRQVYSLCDVRRVPLEAYRLLALVHQRIGEVSTCDVCPTKVTPADCEIIAMACIA